MAYTVRNRTRTPLSFADAHGKEQVLPSGETRDFDLEPAQAAVTALDTRLGPVEGDVLTQGNAISSLNTTTSTHTSAIASITASLAAANIDYSAQFNTALIA